MCEEGRYYVTYTILCCSCGIIVSSLSLHPCTSERSVKMGKPRMIILIRHAQSEGNKNREVHQMIPDHRIRLTEDGWKQVIITITPTNHLQTIQQRSLPRYQYND